MTDVPSMFPDFPFPEAAAPEPEPKLSADRRRTARQRGRVGAGIHPLASVIPALRIARDADTDGTTCGNCQHRRPGRFPKCTRVPSLTVSRGAATDCRAWWPACTYWEPKP